MFSDAGLVATPRDEWGHQSNPLARDLRMRVLRTPHNVVAEHQPEHVADWGQYRITPNGGLMYGAADDALTTLERAGSRGATLLGAGVGVVFSSRRLRGALMGGLVGYLGGQYLVNLAKKALAVQQAMALPPTKAG